MEVHLRPETESRLRQLASEVGIHSDELVEEATAAYLHDLAHARELLDSRYDDIKSGRVRPVDGKEAFARLRRLSLERRKQS
jgi:predicted DNA-binding protein